MVPSWEWLRMHVDPARSRAVVAGRAGRAGARAHRCGLPAEEVDRRLRSLPGIGVWTSAEVRFRAHGDADAVSFGDYHIAKNVGWALTGRAVDDDGAGRAAGALPAAPLPGPAPGRAGRARAGRGTARGWRRARHLPVSRG